MKTLAKKTFWLVALILWMSLMFYFSSVPGLSSGISWDFVLRKIAHMGEYSVLTFLAYKNTKLYWSKAKKRNHFIVAFLFALLFAVSDEWHQSFVANRHGTPFDLIYDASGALIMIGLLCLPTFVARKK